MGSLRQNPTQLTRDDTSNINNHVNYTMQWAAA